MMSKENIYISAELKTFDMARQCLYSVEAEREAGEDGKQRRKYMHQTKAKTFRIGVKKCFRQQNSIAYSSFPYVSKQNNKSTLFLHLRQTVSDLKKKKKTVRNV